MLTHSIFFIKNKCKALKHTDVLYFSMYRTSLINRKIGVKGIPIIMFSSCFSINVKKDEKQVICEL